MKCRFLKIIINFVAYFVEFQQNDNRIFLVFLVF